jgi:hypothetical protein
VQRPSTVVFGGADDLNARRLVAEASKSLERRKHMLIFNYENAANYYTERKNSFRRSATSTGESSALVSKVVAGIFCIAVVMRRSVRRNLFERWHHA